MLNETNRSENKKTYSVNEVAEMLGISIRNAYKLCGKTNEFKVFKCGKRILIHRISFDFWLNDGVN